MTGILIKNRTSLHRSSRSLSSIPVVPGVQLSRWSHGELAARLVRRAGAEVEPGIGWARSGDDRPEKQLARREVLRLFDLKAHPGYLSILTFPGMDWRFEHQLLAKRERPTDVNYRSLDKTYICGIEREETVFRAAIPHMPRGLKGAAARFYVHPTPEFATASIGTMAVKRYHRCAFEDYATSDESRADRGRVLFDAAWLDFNGHLGRHRLAAIVRFWTRQIGGALVVTLMNARTHPAITALIRHHGSVEKMLEAQLVGSECIHAIHYGDTVPMVQLAFRRVCASPAGDLAGNQP